MNITRLPQGIILIGHVDRIHTSWYTKYQGFKYAHHEMGMQTIYEQIRDQSGFEDLGHELGIL